MRSLDSFVANTPYFIATNPTLNYVELKVKSRGVLTLTFHTLSLLILRVNPPYHGDFFCGLLTVYQKLLNNCYNYD